MEILKYLVFIGLVILGGLPTLYLTISIPVVLIYKVYRKARYHISLMD